MNKMMMLGGVALCVAAFSGCCTDPLDYPVDADVYTPTVVRPVAKDVYKIAVVSSAIPHKNDRCKDSLMAKDMEDSIVNVFHGLGSFETVDRKNGIAIVQEEGIAGIDDAAAKADFLLVAKSRVLFVAKQGWKRTDISGKARGADVKTDFQLIDIATKQPILAQSYTSIVEDMDKGDGNLDKAIEIVCARNAAKFARLVAARLLPEVRVKQTRGEGRFALVAMGGNYQANPAVKSWKFWPYKYFPLCYLKTEDVPATQIDFFYTDKDGEEYDNVIIGNGTVMDAHHANKECWVEVTNPDKANVRKGHSAIVHEEKSDIK